MANNSQSIHTEKEKIALLSVGSNTFLVLLKLIVGLTLGSISIISEAIHSGMDLLASIVAYFSVKKSALAPDDDHSFGHGKYESVSGMFEAILIFVAAVIIIYEAGGKILEPTAEPMDPTLMLAGIAVMGISALANAFVSSRLMKIAKKTESIALESDAWHLRTDVYTSVGVLAGLVLIRLTGITILDSIVAIGVALVIMKAAYDLTQKSYKDLIDCSLTDDEIKRITTIICEHYSDYVSYHGLRTRRAGPEIFIEFHLVVDKSVSVEQSHDLTDHLEDDLKLEFPRAYVTIHVEPNTGENAHKPSLCENTSK
ncbi:MAG TPA: cation diffusion facilitator family transporter [Methanospirillum sp.]|uniref:cation diffusion facilitator family transporter n=1 Tax=Methanospirillum sp. TaxID=45200 RepID=UPI002C629DE1|nr:cation diffusion facilitator family transporter [Methanospirillum sp.]HWQ62907.1 cation diffusion facilitator family transporter [Methanospirillum sp.]